MLKSLFILSLFVSMHLFNYEFDQFLSFLQYFNFLRDPFERYISTFFYINLKGVTMYFNIYSNIFKHIFQYTCNYACVLEAWSN